MNKINFIISVIITFIILGSTDSFSQDWPQFRGMNRDSKVTGFKSPSVWPAELKQVWKVTVGTGDATPVIVGKKIYLHTRQGGDEIILCLDAISGKEIWRNNYPALAVTGPPASHPGPRSTPAVANNKIVTVGVSGIISCLDASTGKVVWRKENVIKAAPDFWTGMSPLIADNYCILCLGKKDTGMVIAYDINTGNEKWKWNGEGPSYSSPSLMIIEKTKLVVLLTEKNLIGLALANGKLQWQVAAPSQQRYFNASSPYIDGQTIIYTGLGTGIKAIKVSKQGEKFITEDLWSNINTGAKWNTPILKNGFIYGFTDQKRIYCINASNGETAWIDKAVTSDFGTIVDCGLVIIGLASTNSLIVLKPDGREYSELAKYKVAETPIYAYPIICGNNIYIKDSESLILYNLK